MSVILLIYMHVGTKKGVQSNGGVIGPAAAAVVMLGTRYYAFSNNHQLTF